MMHTEPRNGASIDRIYLHTNEGLQGTNAAFDLAHFLANNGPDGGGYNVVVDDANTVVAADDDIVTWAEGGDNSHCLSVCMIGYAGTNDWSTPYSTAMAERAAQQVAAWCKVYNVPVVHVPAGAPGQAPTARGIAEHADDHNPLSEGHTDPGAAFPIDLFVMRVQEIISPPVDWHAIAALAAWQKAVDAEPLRWKQSRPEVLILKELLVKRGYHVDPGPLYGNLVTVAVAQFKSRVKLSNRIGEVCGADCARALLSSPL